MKRILATVLTLALVIGVVPMAGAATVSPGLLAKINEFTEDEYIREYMLDIVKEHDFSDGPVYIGYSDKHLLYEDGSELVLPDNIHYEFPFYEGYAAVYNDDTHGYGYIDTQGNIVVPCVFGECIVGYGMNMMAHVHKDRVWVLKENYFSWDMPGFDDETWEVAQYDIFAETLITDWTTVPALGEKGMHFIWDTVDKCSDCDGYYIYSTGISPQDMGVAFPSTAAVNVDGNPVQFQMYKLRDSNGGETNYVKLRDVAYVINGTKAQFSIGWSQERGIFIGTGEAYTPNGSEMKTTYTGNQQYEIMNGTTDVDGSKYWLQAFTLQSGGYTYFKLRDLGKVLGFNVGYSDAKGVFIETDKPYTDED